jgi:hypothetical protein
MPNVPNLPGVPPLNSYSAGGVVLLAADIAAAIFGFSTQQWGIFLDGEPVLAYDNQVNFSYSQEWKVSTYPVEQGAFQSYNKVQLPSQVRCRFSAGASATNRQEMLQSIDAVMSTTELYDVVTPEAVYLGYNFVRREYDREAANVGLVSIDVVLAEIMETATAPFQNTQTPAVAGQVGLGNVGVPQTDAATQTSVAGQGWN